MKLALGTLLWAPGPPPDVLSHAMEAERLGYDTFFVPEGWGTEAFGPLAWIGAHTTRLRLGTSVAQISGRTPTAMAAAAMMLDRLTEGRVVLGLGASGPQVVEGWYGQPFPKPLARTREYVEIMRRVIARDEPVVFQGDHYQLPYPGGSGLGKPLRALLHPYRSPLPIYLGAEGPKNVALAAEIADGWLPWLFSPSDDVHSRACLAEGFARRPGGRPPDFDVIAMVLTAIDDDVERAADALRPVIALYVGGMGARGANFHFDVFARAGYEGEAVKIQDLYLAGRKADAAAAVPTKMIEEIALVGPPDKVRADLDRWRASVATTLAVVMPKASLSNIRLMAELVLG